jgi:hypothetical protein
MLRDRRSGSSGYWQELTIGRISSAVHAKNDALKPISPSTTPLTLLHSCRMACKSKCKTPAKKAAPVKKGK